MSDPPSAAPDEGVAPFQVDCPTCGRDSDAPEATFLAGPVALVLDTVFLLCQLKCEGCGTGFDRVLWPIEPRVLNGVPEINQPNPEAAGLLARYEALEAGYRQEWETLYAVASDGSFGTRGIDLAECSVVPRPGRPTAADPRLLALPALLAQRSSFLLGPARRARPRWSAARWGLPASTICSTRMSPMGSFASVFGELRSLGRCLGLRR
jgi:hypothetical protein